MIINMGKLIQGVVLAAALVMSGQALAQGKIAIVDAQRAILATDMSKQRLEALRKDADYVANKKQLEKIQAEGEALLEKMKKDGAVMSADQKADHQKKLQEKQADLQFIAGKMQKSEQELARRIMSELGKQTQVAISDIVKSQGIGLLLDAQVAIHADTAFDITAKVTQQLNKNK